MTSTQSLITNPQSTQDGILIIDKPAGWTSHDVVAKVRKLCKTRRVGHTGTLDPFATGVLVICLNRATRLVQFLTGEDKEYLATIHFGFATDTGDLTGQPLAAPVNTDHVNAEAVIAALAQFRGHLQQIPPMYSAKKIGGVKLYEMARRGEEIVRQLINITIKELELIQNNSLPKNEFVIRVVCSSGTYIRTLAEDIGKALGLGAHLVALRRTRAGSCDLSRALSLDQLTELSASEKIHDALIPMAAVLNLPKIQINELQYQLLQHGRAFNYPADWSTGEQVQLLYHNSLTAIAEYDNGMSLLKPRIVLL